MRFLIVRPRMVIGENRCDRLDMDPSDSRLEAKPCPKLSAGARFFWAGAVAEHLAGDITSPCPGHRNAVREEVRYASNPVPNTTIRAQGAVAICPQRAGRPG